MLALEFLSHTVRASAFSSFYLSLVFFHPGRGREEETWGPSWLFFFSHALLFSISETYLLRLLFRTIVLLALFSPMHVFSLDFFFIFFVLWHICLLFLHRWGFLSLLYFRSFSLLCHISINSSSPLPPPSFQTRQSFDPPVKNTKTFLHV